MQRATQRGRGRRDFGHDIGYRLGGFFQPGGLNAGGRFD
jgi:hypothetical protein